VTSTTERLILRATNASTSRIVCSKPRGGELEEKKASAALSIAPPQQPNRTLYATLANMLTVRHVYFTNRTGMWSPSSCLQSAAHAPLPGPARILWAPIEVVTKTHLIFLWLGGPPVRQCLQINLHNNSWMSTKRPACFAYLSFFVHLQLFVIRVNLENRIIFLWQEHVACHNKECHCRALLFLQAIKLFDRSIVRSQIYRVYLSNSWQCCKACGLAKKTHSKPQDISHYTHRAHVWQPREVVGKSGIEQIDYDACEVDVANNDKVELSKQLQLLDVAQQLNGEQSVKEL
jgi:hypothetical protein